MTADIRFITPPQAQAPQNPFRQIVQARVDGEARPHCQIPGEEREETMSWLTYVSFGVAIVCGVACVVLAVNNLRAGLPFYGRWPGRKP